MKKQNKKYCSYCGTKMIETDVPAETKQTYCYGLDCQKIPMGSAYNTKTGKRQYVKEFTCPNFQKHCLLTDKHDNYYIDDVFTK